MASLIAINPRELVNEHRDALVKYGAMALVRGEELSGWELDDQRGRMREFLGLGTTFGLTDREMVTWLFRDVFAGKKRCGCHSCRAREDEEA